jgi:hypothetical protein
MNVRQNSKECKEKTAKDRKVYSVFLCGSVRLTIYLKQMLSQ